ncbi:MAG: hypothetical protein Q9184_002407 [Pyrenodesmia sp. 2 TL-2023]
MNNTHGPVQPAIPLHHNRRQQEIHYAAPPPPLPHVHHVYHPYQHPYSHPAPSQHYQQPHQQQWYPYQLPMPMPMSRPYQHYPSLINPPYQSYSPQQQVPPHVQPRPHPPPNPSSFSTVPSHHDVLSPASSNASLHVPCSGTRSVSSPRLPPPSPTPPPPPSRRLPYYPPLPWYSFTEGSFPHRDPRRRRRRPAPQSPTEPVELPPRAVPSATPEPASLESPLSSSDTPQPSEAVPAQSSLETPLTSHAPSETDSTQPTTPSSAVLPNLPRQQDAVSNKPIHKPTLSVPIIPAIPHFSLPSRPAKRTSVSIVSETVGPVLPSNVRILDDAVATAVQADQDDASNPSEPNSTPKMLAARVAPRSWADLVRTKVSNPASELKTPENKMLGANGFEHPKATSMVEVLRTYQSGSCNDRVSFIEPRGLVNTGNMCYMNSVLQILVFCVPFYDLLEQLGRRAAHSFKSETPLVDAMVMFMHEYRVIDSAESVEKLRLRLRKDEFEQYGDAFIPEFVYEIIRRLPRFSSMRRGHQQDAEEFLGFLLEEMHGECSRAMMPTPSNMSSDKPAPANGVVSLMNESTNSTSAADSGWLEVGPKQKAATTRSSGTVTTESPITKIFGGKLRSELRVPGMKHSVTLEPYQPLQLDIGAPQVNNIIDALKGLTRSETLHGDFNSPRGPGVAATKQVTIETVPQVLILHLKRFQYDNKGGTQKIWKKIGYPLDLEIPKEVFPQHRRGGILAHNGLPKYRLIGVVYHHGKNASGGHYTVDVRRQDGREWIRIDDTLIRRVRSEDVAAGGSEEDPKVLAAALQQHENDVQLNQNLYDSFAQENEEQAEAGKGWNHVNGMSFGATGASRKWSGVDNGTWTPQSSSGHRTPIGRFPVKDNRVAYLLFYEKAKL